MNFFRDLPIKRKLTVGVLLTSTASLLLASIAYFAYERSTYRSDRVRTLTILADVLGANSTTALSLSKASDTKSDAEEILQALYADPDVLSAALYSHPEGKFFASFVRSDAEEVLPSAPADGEPRFSGGRFTVIRPVMLNDKRIGTIVVVSSSERINAQLHRYMEIGALVILASVLVAAGLAGAFQRLISKPILALFRAAQLVTENKDYSVRAERFGGDELGRLTDAFNQMLAAIEAQSAELGAANLSMKAQTAQITESVEVLGSSAREILNFTTQSTAAATETATAITETTATVEEVRQTVHTSSEKACYVAESAERSAQISETGLKSAEASIDGMKHIRQQMVAIAESMIRLSEQTQDIGQIVAAVEDLAAQSHLLAVNAAIEAAKAGDQGKGFAVVAQEVRSLAQQSKQATTQVRAILKEIQKATSAAVMVTEQGGKAVDTGVAQSTHAGESIRTLSESVRQAAQAAAQISASSHQQLVGMDHVATAMESVRQAGTQNVDSARHLEAAARRLSELGEKLRLLLSESGKPTEATRQKA